LPGDQTIQASVIAQRGNVLSSLIADARDGVGVTDQAALAIAIVAGKRRTTPAAFGWRRRNFHQFHDVAFDDAAHLIQARTTLAFHSSRATRRKQQSSNANPNNARRTGSRSTNHAPINLWSPQRPGFRAAGSMMSPSTACAFSQSFKNVC